MLLFGLQDILRLAVQPPQKTLEGVQTSALVSVVSLRAESEVVVFEGDPDVCRAGFGVPFSVGGTFGPQVLAGLPPLGSKESLAIGLGVARPLGVVGVVSKLSLAVRGR